MVAKDFGGVFVSLKSAKSNKYRLAIIMSYESYTSLYSRAGCSLNVGSLHINAKKKKLPGVFFCDLSGMLKKG